eukprot:gnl/Hemi2/7613_TR2619_c0_g1_i1.p2 gnl/Hemi2/7613_TR2619_c0_g1~~gnl/Hemi2/7613_TR2619_c0_g1_i1.p2  ORF type:complete len:182 (+),score=63.69 gnl/Hemi2/7613_TR2619_c0_g1_i1:61-546(+)
MEPADATPPQATGGSGGATTTIVAEMMEGKSLEQWSDALSPENPHRAIIIEDVCTFLRTCKDPEVVSSTVRGFMAGEDLPGLVKVLKVIVLENSEFASNAPLQNLLLLTVIKLKDKVDFRAILPRLDLIDSSAIASMCDASDLPDEAALLRAPRRSTPRAV